MNTDQTELIPIRSEVIARGQLIYNEKLKANLEQEHMGCYVAIDPETGRYFLGATSAEALSAAHDALPLAYFYLMRIGYETAHKIGGHAINQR